MFPNRYYFSVLMIHFPRIRNYNSRWGEGGAWRILVGPDAERLDQLVRQSPEQAYDIDFFEAFAREVGWRVGS